MGYVHQMDAAWLLRPWILDVTPLFGTPHWFSTQHLILSQQLLKPQLHKDVASGKGALLRGAHVETVNCLELVVFLVSDRCHYESLETVNTLQCPVRLLPCTRAPRDTFWELGLKCFWYCWFEDSTLSPQGLKEITRQVIFWAFSHFLWQYLLPLKCWKARNAEKYIQICHQFFFSIADKTG